MLISRRRARGMTATLSVNPANYLKKHLRGVIAIVERRKAVGTGLASHRPRRDPLYGPRRHDHGCGPFGRCHDRGSLAALFDTDPPQNAPCHWPCAAQAEGFQGRSGGVFKSK